jgi:hypothetical protein
MESFIESAVLSWIGACLYAIGFHVGDLTVSTSVEYKIRGSTKIIIVIGFARGSFLRASVSLCEYSPCTNYITIHPPTITQGMSQCMITVRVELSRPRYKYVRKQPHTASLLGRNGAPGPLSFSQNDLEAYVGSPVVTGAATLTPFTAAYFPDDPDETLRACQCSDRKRVRSIARRIEVPHE